MSDTAPSPLRRTREARGLSLRQAAELAGMDSAHLSRVERGVEGLSVASLARLASVIGLTRLAFDLAAVLGDPPGKETV